MKTFVPAVLPSLRHREADVPVPRHPGAGATSPGHLGLASAGQLHAVTDAPLLPAQQPGNPVQVCHGPGLPALGAGTLTFALV